MDELYQKMQESLIEAREKIAYQQRIIEYQERQLNLFRQIQSDLEKSIDTIEHYQKKREKESQDLADTIVTQAIENADLIINDALEQSKGASLEYTVLEKNIDIFKRRMRSFLEEELNSLKQLDE